MNGISRQRLRIAAVLMTLALVAGVPAGLGAQDTVPGSVMQALVTATVQILILDQSMKIVGTGSGSILTPDGVIVTNFHVIGDTKTGRLSHPQGLVGIALNREGQVNAVPAYIARAIVGNTEPDMALVKIVADVQGRPVQNLNLPTVPIGDATQVRIGDPIAVLGFPGLGGNSITAARGTVTGFVAGSGGGRAYIKHDAQSGPGASGGPVINARGEQVAVHVAGRFDPRSGMRVPLAIPLDRVPSAWAQHLRGATIGASPPSTPSRPSPPPASTPVPSSPSAPPSTPSTPSTPSGPPSTGGALSGQQPGASGSPGTGGALSGQVPGPGGTGAAGGIGALSSQPVVTGVTIRGKIIDEDTKQGITGAIFVAFKPGTPRERLTDPDLWNDEDLAAEARADSAGNFQLSNPLQRGQIYPVAVGARGYQVLMPTRFSLTISQDWGTTTTLRDITLKRQ
ncbi:MAG: trypsin-like peptidase domain-containing protein [Armatimonadetes bacterium]|nr:trypsin-like peptidase domain-containing protein [Armatimonadota bacterium]